MIRATLKSLLSRKLRLILSGLAVILGVMFVSGSFVLTDTLTRSFDQLFAGVFANTSVQVSAVPKVGAGQFDDSERVTSTLTQADLERVRGVDGVASATGVAFADGARLIGSDGKTVPTVGPPRFGADWPSQASSVELRQGRGPTADNEIAINAALAVDAGVKVGDQVGVLTLQPRQTFTLVGIFGYPGGRDSQGGAQVVAFTLPVAQRLMLGQPDVFSNVDVKAEPGISDDQLRDRVAAALGDGYQVKTGKQLADDQATQLQTGLKFFNYILIGFASVSLFVAVFLILNTFSIIVAQRTSELALLRAIGASRRQVIGSVVLEAVVVGLLSSVIGLGLGIGVGTLLAKVFSNFGGGGLELASIGVPMAAWISAFAVGLGITVVAALIPAFRAARIAPVAALRESATRPLTRLTIAGSVVLGLARCATLGLLTPAARASGPSSAACCSPLSAQPRRARGPTGGKPDRAAVCILGAGRLGRLKPAATRRTVTAAALMVGIALITGINTVFVSAKQSVTKIG
jgi:putative ABC transport system permease protein